MYMVSSIGRVASLWRQHNVPIIMRQSIIKTKKCEYYSVMLYGENKAKRCTVHRLVALAFIPNPNKYPCIDHINRNSKDNRVENLRWCTLEMNMKNELTREVLNSCHKGADKSYRWRPVAQIKNGKTIRVFKSIAEAVKEGFCSSKITLSCQHKRPRHKGYQWEYL